jgi:hypothetical protein
LGLPAVHEPALDSSVNLDNILFGDNDQEDDMASRLKFKRSRFKALQRNFQQHRVIWLEAIAVFLIVVIVGAKALNYAHITPDVKGMQKRVAHTVSQVKFKLIDKPFAHCPKGQQKIILQDGYLCRPATATNPASTAYDTLPLHGQFKSEIYPSLGAGSMASANAMLENRYQIERFDPVQLTASPKWTENPYNDIYWRFSFLGLRTVNDLIYASRTTHDPKYDEKMLEVIKSYINTGSKDPSTWTDYHAVAFRTMTMTDAWYVLREHKRLSVDDANMIYNSIQQHGEFLEDVNHYEPGHNHGTNEAAAMYSVSISFPNMPKADEWHGIALSRLESSLEGLVDNDGALVENSPYYHFYTLQKYWDIESYASRNNDDLGADYKAGIASMVHYATYILQPDGHVPLLGASLDARQYNNNQLAQLAKLDPEFRYALTAGAQGSKPKHLSESLASTGQAILRSGWQTGKKFRQQTQVIFDIGAYRTDHSHLDALSFNLYGLGRTLMPDAGLYSYEHNDYYSYFHGTSSHNTVMVDGKDQAQGTAIAGDFKEGNGYSYQTAEESLNLNVVHKRAIALMGTDQVAVVDRMSAANTHTYDQRFRLFPGAKIKTSGTDVEVYDEKNILRMTIRQMNPEGITLHAIIDQKQPIDGYCSQEYKKLIPCYTLDYKAVGANVNFTTVITLGNSRKLSANMSTPDLLTMKDGTHRLDLSISELKEQPLDVKSTNAGGYVTPAKDQLSIKGSDCNKFGSSESSVTGDTLGTDGLVIRTDHIATKTECAVSVGSVDLKKQNLALQFMQDNREAIDSFSLYASNNNWADSARINLNNVAKSEYNNQLQTVILPYTQLRSSKNGGWVTDDKNFDWGNIDAIKIVGKSKQGMAALFTLKNIGFIDAQKSGKVVLIFDDGYESILPAAQYMHSHNLKGNVAVIGKYASLIRKGYLSLAKLKFLQNSYGWSMANHSMQHKDAVGTYSYNNGLKDYEKDILDGAQFLIDNSLNSAPNWYIYPHGTTNQSCKDVVGKYYTYARTTANAPESYPFGDSLAIKTLPLENDDDSSTSSSSTSPEEVINVIKDTENNGGTLFLTLHRIKSTPSDRAGYKLDDFKKIVDYLSTSKAKTETLAELDKDNGVPQNHLSITTARPEQIKVDPSIESTNPLIKTSEDIFNRFFHK